MSTFVPFRRTRFRPKFRAKGWSPTYQKLVDSQFLGTQEPQDIPAYIEGRGVELREDLPVSLETLPLYQQLESCADFDFSRIPHRGHLFDALKKHDHARISLLSYQLFGSSTLILRISSQLMQSISRSISDVSFRDRFEDIIYVDQAISRLNNALETAMIKGVGILPLAPVAVNGDIIPPAFEATGLILSVLRKHGALKTSGYYPPACITGFSSVISPNQIIIIDPSSIDSMDVFDFDKVFAELITPQYELYRDSMADEFMGEGWEGDRFKRALPQNNPLTPMDSTSRKIPRIGQIKSVMTTDELRTQVAQVYAQNTQSVSANGQPRLSAVTSTFSVQSRNDPTDPNIPGIKSSVVHGRDVYLWIDVSPSVSYDQSVASLRIAYDILKHMKINVAHIGFFGDTVSEVLSIPIAGRNGLDRFLATVEDMWVKSDGTRVDLVMDTIRSSPVYSQAFNLIVTDFGFTFSSAQPYHPNIFFAPVDAGHQNILYALNYDFAPSLTQYAPAYQRHILGVRR